MDVHVYLLEVVLSEIHGLRFSGENSRGLYMHLRRVLTEKG